MRLSELRAGDEATLAESTPEGGTQNQRTLAAGTRVRVAWPKFCRAWDPWDERWTDPLYLPADAEVTGVVRRADKHGAAPKSASAGDRADGDLLDPLLRGAS